MTFKTRLQTWKKDVCDGSTPVLAGGTTTSIGATNPTGAGAPTCLVQNCYNQVSQTSKQDKAFRTQFKDILGLKKNDSDFKDNKKKKKKTITKLTKLIVKWNN